MDVDLWWRIAMHGEPVIVKKALSEYRVHQEAKTISSLEKSNAELISWSYKNLIQNSNDSYA